MPTAFMALEFLVYNMKLNLQKLLIWFSTIFFLMALYSRLNIGMDGVQRLNFSQFLNEVESGNVNSVIIDGRDVTGILNSNAKFKTVIINYNDLVGMLRRSNVDITIAENGDSLMGILGSILISWFPMILIVLLWVFLLRQVSASGNRAFGFGKSRVRFTSENDVKVTFKDVAGADDAKEDLAEIVEFLRCPEKFHAVGGKIPKGCLLVGNPGTGKTLLARAVSGEASVPFLSISGSDFVEMFVGVGASRVRDLFSQARKNAPCIIFIDEIDAVGRHRGVGVGGGSDEREHTLNQLLVEMDGFHPNEGIIILAATNRADVLDNALLRPGRFDRRIMIAMPDIKSRKDILEVHLRSVLYDKTINVTALARSTPGFSGADLRNLVNESALLAAKKNRKKIAMNDFETSRDKIIMGSIRKSLSMTDEEKKLTAYHEAGHALVAAFNKASDKIYKATIIPRGASLGAVTRLPEDDRVSLSRDKMEADIAVAMGGRIAEELIFGYHKVTSGASCDIMQATKMARAMITKWGMSTKVGMLYHASEKEHHYEQSQKISSDSLKIIDAEIKGIIDLCYEGAKRIINEHIDKLHALASALLEHEVLTGDEIKTIVHGGIITKSLDDENDSQEESNSSFGGSSNDKQDNEEEQIATPTDPIIEC